MLVLIISFLLVVFVLGYTMITQKPSKSCGPFRNNKKTIIETIGIEVGTSKQIRTNALITFPQFLQKLDSCTD